MAHVIRDQIKWVKGCHAGSFSQGPFQGMFILCVCQLWEGFWTRGTRWDSLLLQGLLKMEDVALTVSPGWTELDSSQVKSYRDERQEDGGPLTSLGKSDGHRLLVRFPGFLCI